MDNSPINILFVCSMNKWRSPTAEKIYSSQPALITRSAGTSKKARKHVTESDLKWADIIVVMENKHRQRIKAAFPQAVQYQPIHVLDIEDNYQFMDQELIDELRYAIDPIIENLSE